MLPPVSLPIEKPTRPAAVAAPGPGARPRAPSSSSHGFIVCPPNQMSLSASAPRLSLATSTAPASCSRFTTAASAVGTRLRNGSAPYVVGMPAVSSRSLTPHGMPCSGPRYLPAAISASACFACASAESRVSVMIAAQLRIEALDAIEIDLRQPLGGELCALDPARELRDRREGDVGVARRAAGRDRSRCARSGRASGRGAGPASTGFQRVAGASVGLERDLARARPGARAAAPSTAPARGRHARARRWSSSTCASFSASANVDAETAGPAARRRAERRRRARRLRWGSLCVERARRGQSGQTEWGGDQELPARVHGLASVTKSRVVHRFKRFIRFNRFRRFNRFLGIESTAMSSLQNAIALVTGASRGAGRGIALELGAAGATVYVTARSVSGGSTTDNVPGTVDECAREITSRGGRGIAVQCDHTDR